MTTPRGPHWQACLSADARTAVGILKRWHGTCNVSLSLKNDSHPFQGSVNFSDRSAKASTASQKNLQDRTERTDDSDFEDWCDSIHGAGGHAYRKRSHVRAACGGAMRPSGLGNITTHGHFGRLVVRWFLPPGMALPSHVLPPDCEAVLRQRHLARGPGLPAALTTAVVAFGETPALANRASRATRPPSPNLIRAASIPPTSPGTSCGRGRPTQTQPTHASASGQESMPFFHGDHFAQGSARSQPVGFVSRS